MREDFIDNLLSQLGAGSKELVFVSVSQSVGLEVIQLDSVSKTVKNYACRPLEYNEAMREIADYSALRTELGEIFKELKINPKCNLYISLPMVHWGKIDLPLLLNDEAVNEAIISEVEQSYLFKKCEPVVSWFEVLGNNASENRTLIYSAIQKPVMQKLEDVALEFGATIRLVETSAISTLRALAYTGLAETQMADNVGWNLLLINSYGYSLFAMNGKNIMDYYEEPLAFKTFELEGVYDAINTSAQLVLMNFPSNYLYIVSETDTVSAELLSKKINFDGTIKYFDDNSLDTNDILPVDLAVLPDYKSKISLKAIGVGASTLFDYPAKINFLGAEQGIESDEEATLTFNFNGQEKVLTETTLRKVALVFSGILILPALVAMLVLPNIQKKKQASLDELNSKVKQLESQINELTQKDGGSFDVNNEIETVLKNNRAKLIAYSALGESVPKGLWITYYRTTDSGKVDIKGASSGVEDVYKFFKNMKDSTMDTGLRLHKLEMLSSDLDTAVSSFEDGYSFEITNMSDAEINPPAEESTEGDANATGAKPNSQAKPANTNAGATGRKAVKDLEPVDVEGK